MKRRTFVKGAAALPVIGIDWASGKDQTVHHVVQPSSQFVGCDIQAEPNDSARITTSRGIFTFVGCNIQAEPNDRYDWLPVSVSRYDCFLDANVDELDDSLAMRLVSRLGKSWGAKLICEPGKADVKLTFSGLQLPRNFAADQSHNLSITSWSDQNYCYLSGARMLSWGSVADCPLAFPSAELSSTVTDGTMYHDVTFTGELAGLKWLGERPKA